MMRNIGILSRSLMEFFGIFAHFNQKLRKNLRQSEIKIVVNLDDKNMPEEIRWFATDSGHQGSRDAKAFSLSIWDKEESATMGIDLWTREMLIEDMNKHFYQTFMKMADTYSRSTNNRAVSDMIREFADNFWQHSNSEKIE